jgi:5,10-methylenetetrahydrofolate reductase
MLSTPDGFRLVAEVNPPDLPDTSHLLLEGVWDRVLITDNVFGRIRVSPYAFAARITHDVPSVDPTVVVSTRDRNILAIESEVRGALGNGVESFLVVTGDTLPAVEHMSDHYEIVEHLRDLQDQMPAFEVGMPTRFRAWQHRRRVGLGAQFFVAGPVLDPATVAPNIARMERRDDDPPVYLMIIPPFGPDWVDRMEQVGAVPMGARARARLEEAPADGRRELGWELAVGSARAAQEAGCAGAILMGLSFSTVVDEAAERWRVHGGPVTVTSPSGRRAGHHHLHH